VQGFAKLVTLPSSAVSNELLVQLIMSVSAHPIVMTGISAASST
jgi:hypothetical protein